MWRRLQRSQAKKREMWPTDEIDPYTVFPLPSLTCMHVVRDTAAMALTSAFDDTRPHLN